MGKKIERDKTTQKYEAINIQEQSPNEERELILGLSIIEVYILKEVASYQKKGIVRYQLLKVIENQIGKKMLSTAKFYRILQKFNKEGLVQTLEEKEISSSSFMITKKGHLILNLVQKTTAFSNITIFSMLQEKLSRLIQQVTNTVYEEEEQRKEAIEIMDQLRATGKLPKEAKKPFKQGLFIDWTAKGQDDLARFVQLMCEHAHIMVPESKLEETKLWKNEDLGITLYSHGRIREINDEFDFVIVIAAALLPNQSKEPFLEEVVRVLKPGGVVLVTQIEVLPRTSTGKHHLIIDMLLNTIPLPFIPRCAMVEKDFHNLIGTLELENVTHVNYDGLLAVTGQKPHLKVE